MGPTWNEALPTRTVRRLVNLYIDTCGREGGFSCRLVGASLRLRPREPPLRASCLSSNARRVDISPCLTNLLFGMQSTTIECSSVHVTVSAPTHTHTHTRARACFWFRCQWCGVGRPRKQDRPSCQKLETLVGCWSAGLAEEGSGTVLR